MVVIPAEHGFDAAAAAEVKDDPTGKTAYNRRRDTLKLMRKQGNEQEARLAKIEDDLLHRPF